MAHSYPRFMSAKRFAAPHHKYPACFDCGNAFIDGEAFALIEVQVSWMRGDDEYWPACSKCCVKNGVPFPSPPRPPKIKANKRTCQQCGKQLRNAQGVIDHVRAVHQGAS